MDTCDGYKSFFYASIDWASQQSNFSKIIKNSQSWQLFSKFSLLSYSCGHSTSSSNPTIFIKVKFSGVTPALRPSLNFVIQLRPDSWVRETFSSVNVCYLEKCHNWTVKILSFLWTCYILSCLGRLWTVHKVSNNISYLNRLLSCYLLFFLYQQ